MIAINLNIPLIAINEMDPSFQLKVNIFRLNKQKSSYMLLVKDTPKTWHKTPKNYNTHPLTLLQHMKAKVGAVTRSGRTHHQREKLQHDSPSS